MLAHAIQATQNPGFTSTDGLGSGFGDLIPAVLHDEKHVNVAATRGSTAPWAASARRYDRTWLFSDATIVGESARGERWASALFEIYRKLGGDSGYPGVRSAARDLIIRLHLQANAAVPASPTTTQMAQQVEAADGNLGRMEVPERVAQEGRLRHLPSPPADGVPGQGRGRVRGRRASGGYGSPSGNDLFTENLGGELLGYTGHLGADGAVCERRSPGGGRARRSRRAAGRKQGVPVRAGEEPGNEPRRARGR